MKRGSFFARASVVISVVIMVLMVGFGLFPDNLAAQLFQTPSYQTPSFLSYTPGYNALGAYSTFSSNPFGSSWLASSGWSNNWSVSPAPGLSSTFSPLYAGSGPFWGYNPASSWLALPGSSSLNLSWAYPSTAFSFPYSAGQSPANQLFLGSNQSIPWYQTTPSLIMPGWGNNPWFSFIQPVKLDYKVKTDQTEYSPGEPIEITFTVTNVDNVPLTLNFTSGQQFDVIVTGSGKSKVWQMSSHMFYTMALTTLRLAKGESKEFYAQWDQKDEQGQLVPSGTYTVEAFLTPTDGNYSQRASCRITILPEALAGERLPRFSNCQKLREKLDEIANTAKSGSDYGIFALTAAAPVDAVRIASSTEAGAASDYSTTNIQVAGVDESDQIKNDGSYIYMIKGKSVRIIRAYPATNMKELPKIDYANSTFSPEQLFVDGNTLIVIGRDYAPTQSSSPEVGIMTTSAIRAPAIYPYYIRTRSLTRVIIYDITDRSRVRERRNIKFEATYLQSRRVDNTLYLVMNQYPQYIVPLDTKQAADNPQTLLPKYADSTEAPNDQAICDCDEVSYFPGSSESRYLIVAAIPINDPEAEIGKEVILGSSENIYSSISNLYVAQTSYTDSESKESAIRYSYNPDTLIYKFNFDKAKISYTGRGKVPGTILNQFSMDEYDGYFRIATTKGQTWDMENLSSNNLYVLDKEMKVVGRIEGIARGESIKSVRFMGDRAYMVTFVQVDPLFVISLKDPENPTILGELKIPGYSEYLHPYDENHLIGFGREVDASIDADKVHTPGAVYYTALLGMKLSLFDVSDVAHPRELHKEVIGFRYTDSELLRDHKALLFNKAKNFMAFPITVTEKVEDAANTYDNYRYTFQGAYFYTIDLDHGFERKAAITHYDNQEEFTKAGYYFYGGEDDIRRIIYIGDHFYTISGSKIKAIDMQTYKEDNILLLEKDAGDSSSGGYEDGIIYFKGE